MHQAAQRQKAFHANDGCHMLVRIEEMQGVGESLVVLEGFDEDAERVSQGGVEGLSEASFAGVGERFGHALRPWRKTVRRDALVPALHARDEAESEKRQLLSP